MGFVVLATLFKGFVVMWILFFLYMIGIPLGIFLYFIGFKLELFAWCDIIFYRGLLILLLTSLIHGLVIFSVIWLLMKNKVSMAHVLSIVMTSFSLCSTFLIVIPVSLDRSVSVFLLGYVKNMNQPVTKNELLFGLENIYIKNYKAIERRIDEQIQSNNIRQDSHQQLTLSEQGERFVLLSRMIADALGIDKKFIDPDINP